LIVVLVLSSMMRRSDQKTVGAGRTVKLAGTLCVVVNPLDPVNTNWIE
jgi:hypothetical protein